VLLLIEVADSTLKRDRKAKIYARANISEYWIIDINQQRVIVLQDPQGETYRVEQIYAGTEQLTPLNFLDVIVDLHCLILKGVSK